MKDNKNTVKTIMLSIGLVAFVAVIAVSFAYFTVTYEEGEIFGVSGQGKSNAPQITFSENKSGINLPNSYPMPDDMGIEKSDEYVFKVRNDESSRIQVNVYLQISETNTLSDSLVNIQYAGTVYTVSALTPAEKAFDAGYNKAYVLDTFTIEPTIEESRSLKIWANQNGTVDNALNKTWASKIYVTSKHIE